MKPLIRIREFLRPYSWQVALAAIFLLVITAANLVIPEIIRQVIDIGLVGGEKRFLLNAAFVVLGIGLIIAVLDFANRYLSSWLAYRVTFDLRNRLYDHIQHLSFSYHDHTQTGQLISRCIEDVRSIQEFTGTGFFELMRIILLLVGVVILLFVDNPKLAAIALAPMIPLFFTTTHFGSRVGKLFYHVDQALGDLSARLQENVGGAQVVRAFAREPYEIQRFNERNRRLYDARISVIQEWSRVMPTSHFLVAMSTVLILWFGGNMALRGEMTLGEVVAFNSYLLLMAEPARQLVMLVNTAGEASAGIKRIFEVLEEEPEIQTYPNAVELPPLSGLVEFQDVCFKYQGESAAALENINLRVEPNQVVALIGPTGSGKTSLVNLIPRFYEVTRGAVLVDGFDIRQVDLQSLRKQIGIVLQTSLLFSDSVRANIAYGRPDASLDEIIEAAKAAQAHDFITTMSDGYDTEIGERGITLSGWQRQRIAIARALLFDPRILILDDSTSSVDTQTERLIQKALNRLMEGRTTFVIAQRLSSVRRADLILVLDDGRIAERGTHDTLLAQDGLYREVYDLQLRGQEKGLENGVPS
jgi:ATP-binding cassette subfamily B multidrug efflux pump